MPRRDVDPIPIPDGRLFAWRGTPSTPSAVGTRNEARGITEQHHQPRYDLDEAALPIGVEMFVRTVERYLAD